MLGAKVVPHPKRLVSIVKMAPDRRQGGHYGRNTWHYCRQLLRSTSDHAFALNEKDLGKTPKSSFIVEN